MNKKELVNEFQTAAYNRSGLVRPHQEFIPYNDTAKLKARLLVEEAHELVEALYEKDIKEVTKEVCDVLYICYGIAATYNLPIEDAFLEVHKNNMLKINTAICNNGKWIKHKDHPKCNLDYLFNKDQSELPL